MIDLGLLHSFLGTQLWKFNDESFLYQPKYALDIPRKSRISDCKSAPTHFHLGVKFLPNCP